jgi:hypothetical protein
LRPRVTYAYTVNSRVVVAARIADPNTTGRDSKDYVVHNYLPQAPVTVHYNPAATSESVLDATVPRSAYLNLILGTGFACLGLTLFMLIAMPASRRRGWLFWRRP